MARNWWQLRVVYLSTKQKRLLAPRSPPLEIGRRRKQNIAVRLLSPLGLKDIDDDDVDDDWGNF